MPIGTKTLHVNPQSIRLDINVWVPVIVCNGDSFSLGAHSVNRRLLDRDLVISRNLIFPLGHDYYIYMYILQCIPNWNPCFFIIWFIHWTNIEQKMKSQSKWGATIEYDKRETNFSVKK